MSIHDFITLSETCPSSNPASSRMQGTLLRRLLVALVVVFVICVTPQSFTTTQFLELPLARDNKDVTIPTFWGLSNFQFHSVDGGEEFESKFLSHLLNGKREFVSKLPRSTPKHKAKSKTDYALNLRHGHVRWTDGKPLMANGIHFQPERKSVLQIREFLSRESLVATPFDTDGLSPYLTTSQQVTDEAKRIHSNLFRDLYRGKKYAILLQLAAHENKGDAALSVGEVLMLQRVGIQLLFYVNVVNCTYKNYKTALGVAQRHPTDQVVVMLHGGGNIFGYGLEDSCRSKAFKTFRDYPLIFFSQSIYMRATKAHFDFAHKMYCCNPNLTILLRDRLSLHIAQRLFNNGTRLLLAPDMAFEIGRVRRYAPPYYDVIWQKRTDHEGPGYHESPGSLFPANVSTYVWDWLSMPSIQNRNSLMKAVNVLQNGLGILQKGRVVVTDRLHGHILSTLLDIPHVLLDNADQKLSSYHNTWTRGLRICRLADNAKDAARLALELLEEYKGSLPPRLRAADIDETGSHV